MARGTQKWDQFRSTKRLRRSFLALVAISWLVGLLAHTVLKAQLSGLQYAFVGAFTVSAVSTAIVEFRLAHLRCPGCGNRFFHKGMFRNTFSSKCRHCALPLYAEPQDDDEDDDRERDTIG